MEYVWGIKRSTCGVYFIKNKINRKVYVGASVDIASRLCTHFGRDAKRYKNNPFYIDIRNFGKDNFDFGVLEFCEKENLLEKEQYYYDELNPEYNIIRPIECSFNDELVREKSIHASQTKEQVQKRKELFNSEKYKEYFRYVHVNKMKPVRMYNEEVSMEFRSLQECARWLTNNVHSSGKNKASKIKAVCDGERLTAYGFHYEYLS